MRLETPHGPPPFPISTADVVRSYERLAVRPGAGDDERFVATVLGDVPVEFYGVREGVDGRMSFSLARSPLGYLWMGSVGEGRSASLRADVFVPADSDRVFPIAGRTFLVVDPGEPAFPLWAEGEEGDLLVSTGSAVRREGERLSFEADTVLLVAEDAFVRISPEPVDAIDRPGEADLAPNVRSMVEARAPDHLLVVV